MVHLAKEGVQRLSRSTIPVQYLTQQVSHVKVPHHTNPPPVAHQLLMVNLLSPQHLVLVVVPLRDSHPREALRLARVPHQIQLYSVATLPRHTGMVQDQEHVHPQDSVLECQVLQAVCLRRVWSLSVRRLRNSCLSICCPLVSPRPKAPPQGGSERRSLIPMLSIDWISRSNACFLSFIPRFSSSYSPSRSNLLGGLVGSHLFLFCSPCLIEYLGLYLLSKLLECWAFG